MSNKQIIILATIATIAAAILLFRTADDDLGLKVETASGGLLSAFSVTNTGREPITIKNIVINDRAECSNARKNALGGEIFPAKLKTGDVAGMQSFCQIVDLRIETDRGTRTYIIKE